MKKTLASLLIVSMSIFANENINTLDIDTCIDTTKHTNKSFKEMKELVVNKIQDEAFGKFYKDRTSSDFKGELTKTHRDELYVEVKDIYDNGTNFCNKATVSIKDEKLNYFLPQKVSLDRICHKDENLSPSKLKEIAEAKAYKELVSQVSKKEITDEQAKLLVQNYEKKDGKMYMAKGAYCLSASGNVVPFEIEKVILEEKKRLNNIVKDNYGNIFYKDKYNGLYKDQNGKIFITDNFSNEYGLVVSPYTKKIWLDRNLGAKRLCVSATDEYCFGDYYQWGRGSDGHQLKTSSTTDKVSQDEKPNHDKFILKGDWQKVFNKNSWTTEINNPCPKGFRVPTIDEFKDETINKGVKNTADIYNNFLKIPSSGSREYWINNIHGYGTISSIWTISLYRGYRPLSPYFLRNKAGIDDGIPTGYGKNIRCIINK